MLIQDLDRLVPQPHREQPPVEGRAGRVGVPVNEQVPDPVSPARFVGHRLETDPRKLQANGHVLREPFAQGQALAVVHGAGPRRIWP